MTLEAAAIRLIAALRLRAASWLPCEVTPGELAHEWSGPPSALAGRVMRDWLCEAMVRDAMERRGVAVRSASLERYIKHEHFEWLAVSSQLPSCAAASVGAQ